MRSLRRRRGSRASTYPLGLAAVSTESDADDCLHLLLLGRRDNLTYLGFQLHRPPFQLIGMAVP